jgi:hypothetical protein
VVRPEVESFDTVDAANAIEETAVPEDEVAAFAAAALKKAQAGLAPVDRKGQETARLLE